MKPKTLLSLAVVPVVLALAACGSSSNDNSTTTASVPSSSTSTSSAFSTKSVSGVGEILVDSKGNALYTNDQDTTGDIKCTGECTSIWIPLTQNGKPVGFMGKPLYTFAEDTGPGKVMGDGVSDSFGGVDFVWSVATPSGTSPQASSTGSDTTSTGSSSSSGSSGGTGYGGGY